MFEIDLDETRRLLQPADPASHLKPIDPTDKHKVLDRIRTDTSAPSRRVRVSPRRSLGATASLVVLLALALAIPTLGGSPKSGASAAPLLRAVAEQSAIQSDPASTASYWYSHSLDTVLSSDGLIRTADRQVWAGHHSPGRLLTRYDETSAPLLPLETTLPPARFPMGDSSVDWDGLRALPTDTAALLARLEASAPHSGVESGYDVFIAIGDLLRESPISPEVRAALYQVAAALPGVTLGGAGTDPVGRAGTWVGLLDPTGIQRQEYFIAGDGQLLAERLVLVKGDTSAYPGVAGGTELSSSLYLSAGPARNDQTVPATARP